MAGSPTWGKISTGIRRTARNANRAIVISATSTVIGRLSAARTNRMLPLSSLAGLEQKRLNISSHGCDFEQAPPDAQASQRVIYLRLCQQALRLGDFID